MSLFRLFSFINVHLCTLAAMRTIVNVVCPKCGNIGKSGKRSCCGRGGSWFQNCGGAGNKRLRHTWSEGLQACKAGKQYRIVGAQQERAAYNMSTSNPKIDSVNIPINISTSTSVITQGYEKLLNIAIHISLLVTVVCH